MNREITGLVIKEQSSGEKGKLLFVLTESEGVLLVNAKGAKKISASYLKSAQLFAYSKMNVYDKNGYLTLTEAVLLESFYSLRNDLFSLAFSSYACEMAYLSAIPESGGLLKLLLNTLYATENKLAPLMTVKAVYEYRLAVLNGFYIEENSCSGCGKAAFNYNLNDMDFLCGDCTVPEYTNIFTLDEDSLKAMLYLNSCSPGRILNFTINQDSLAVFAGFTEQFLLRNTELKPKSLGFYKSLEDTSI